MNSSVSVECLKNAHVSLEWPKVATEVDILNIRRAVLGCYLQGTICYSI